MLHVVVYDISSDVMRRRTARLLSGYGRRIQESAFECRLDRDRLRQMTDVLGDLLADDPAAQIRIYSLCDLCRGRGLGLGAVPRSEDRPFVVL